MNYCSVDVNMYRCSREGYDWFKNRVGRIDCDGCSLDQLDLICNDVAGLRYFTV